MMYSSAERLHAVTRSVAASIGVSFQRSVTKVPL